MCAPRLLYQPFGLPKPLILKRRSEFITRLWNVPLQPATAAHLDQNAGMQISVEQNMMMDFVPILESVGVVNFVRTILPHPTTSVWQFRKGRKVTPPAATPIKTKKINGYSITIAYNLFSTAGVSPRVIQEIDGFWVLRCHSQAQRSDQAPAVLAELASIHSIAGFNACVLAGAVIRNENVDIHWCPAGREATRKDQCHS